MMTYIRAAWAARHIAGDFSDHVSVSSATSSGISYPDIKFCFLMSWCELDRCTICAPMWLPEIISHHLSLVNVAHWPYSHHLTQKKLTTSNICNADATTLAGKPCLPCTKWKCANCSRTEFLFSHNMNMQTGETVRVTREAQSCFPHRKSCWPRYWIL